MSQAIFLTLPYPPSGNALYRSPGRKTPIKSRAYRQWEADAEAAIPISVRGLVRGPHQVIIEVDRPDRRKRDLDNLTKAIFDALKDHPAKPLKGVIRDDSDTLGYAIAWSEQVPVNPAQVRIWVLPEPTATEPFVRVGQALLTALLGPYYHQVAA